MKTNSTIVGVLTALIVGLLVHVIRSASPEFINTMFCILGLAIVVLARTKYRKQAQRDALLTSNGLNHYRQHIHHRRVIKKTS